jgi:hypothetical protein
VRKNRFVELRARRCRGIHRGNVVGRKRQGRGDQSMSAGRQPGSISDPELVHPDQAKAGGRAESGRRLIRLSDLLADLDADGWNSSSELEVLRLIRRECVAESSRWINRAGNLGESGVAAVGVHADPARGLTTSSETAQVSTCGDDENRTLKPRLANSVHCVRRCAPWPLTCADSPGKTDGVRAGPSARQHHWQHSIRRPPAPTVLARSFRVGHRTVAS